MVEETKEQPVERPFGMDDIKRMHQNPFEAVTRRPTKNDDRAMLFVCYGALLVQPPTQGTKLIIDILSEHLK